MQSYKNMATDNKADIKISVSEIARTLGWEIATAHSIKRRKSPASKYNIYLEAEKKLKEAKHKVNTEFQK